MDEAQVELLKTSFVRDFVTRRKALQQLGISGLVALGTATLAGCGGGSNALSGASKSVKQNFSRDVTRDIDILNFALNTEYLEAEFYTYATTGQGIQAVGIDVSGQNGIGTAATPGPTTGGAQITFTDPNIAFVANFLADDERKHVNVIRKAITSLGGTPIAKPSINLAALATLGVDPTTQAGFVIGGRSFCDVGVSAYGGVSRYLSDKNVIQIAAQILAVEAYHAGNLRLQVARLGLTAPMLDNVDVPPPPANSNYFYVDDKAMAIVRTVRQVLNVVYLATPANPNPSSGGFFPDGAVGNLTSLLSLS